MLDVGNDKCKQPMVMIAYGNNVRCWKERDT